MNEKINLEQLKQMSEAERRTFFFNKKRRPSNPTFKRHLIMRRILKKYHGTGKFTKLTDNKMCKIVDRILELEVARLYLDGYINLGYGLGIIKMVPYEKKITDFYSVPVNYKKTVDYWAKNPEAYKKGIVIRDYNTTKRIKFVWNSGSNPKLKYYVFAPQKRLKRKIYNDYINGKPIAFIQ